MSILLGVSGQLWAEVDLGIISQIESSGGRELIGDDGKSLGEFQISQGVVYDWASTHKMQLSTQEARIYALDAIRARIIADWYLHERIPQMLRHFKKPVTVRNQIIAYNCGIKCVVDGRLPKTSRDYLRKYKEKGGVL